MSWTLSHMPAGQEWERTFLTRSLAIDFLATVICPECRESGDHPFSTSCGCEYDLEEVDDDAPMPAQAGSGRGWRTQHE